MLRTLAIPAVLVLLVSVLWADDPPAARPFQRDQPRAVPAQPAPREGAVRRADTSTLAKFEEEAEVIEAQLDVKRAYTRAAEVGVMGTKQKFNRVAQLRANGTITNEDVEQAKIEMEAAIAQLDIRKAEMKEVEVKLKYAKKRLDEAKAPAPARPNQGRGDPGRDRGGDRGDTRPKDPGR
jgi:hypothetical protein